MQPRSSEPVTLLFTDIEGSTTLVHRLGDAYPTVLAEHRDLLRAATASHGGREIDTQGDAFLIAFADPADALATAIESQRALAAHPWPADGTVRVRIGIHTGRPARTTDGYAGLDVHRGARIAAAGHGGQILLSKSTAESVENKLPPNISLRDLGYHRLKDLHEPERLFQIVLPDETSDFPPLRSLRALTNNLPAQVSSFVGRERDLAEVGRLLGKNRLLTLTGTGGIGKTRLALATAERLAEAYRDGVWLVELASISDPALVVPTTAKVLAIQEEPGRPLSETLAEALKAQHLMLLLDNCEHLAGACAILVDSLLRACPHVQVLATSREALRIAGEGVYRVPTLTVPENSDAATGDDLKGFSAIQLFAERASAVSAGFSLTPQNGPVVAEICRELDGIPLALELAAARISSLSIPILAQKLGDRFSLLTDGSRAAPERQRTLRAAIDWSFALLSEAQQALLARLSVFAGGIELAAVEAVCSGESPELGSQAPLAALSGLVEKSLVIADEVGGDDLRYRLLETIRQYAAEVLDGSGAQYLIHSRHLQYYLELAEESEPALVGPEQAIWLMRLECEHDNCRAALGWSIERGENIAALRLATALGRFWMQRGYLSEGRAWLDRAVAAAENAPTELRARGLHRAGILARNQADYVTAHSLVEESLGLYRALGDRRGVADALLELGIVTLRQGDFDAARPIQEQSLALYRELGDLRGAAGTLLNLGNIARRQGDHLRAVSLREESLALFRAAGDQQGVATALMNLGVAAIDAGEYTRAESRLQESLALARELGDWFITSRSLKDFSHALLGRGESVRAAEACAEALTICRDRADSDGIAYCLEGLAGAAAEEGEHEQAARLLGAAAALREKIRAPLASVDRRVCDRAVATATGALATDGFAIAEAAGRALPLQRAIEEALTIRAPMVREVGSHRVDVQG